jgi:hypothetical protein
LKSRHQISVANAFAAALAKECKTELVPRQLGIQAAGKGNQN